MPHARKHKPAHLSRRKPQFFHPVPIRARHDGWTIARQCEFLAQLYITGCVTTAARAVGMSRMAAYRLRRCDGADGFARAWDRVLMPPGTGRIAATKLDRRKVTDDTVRWHAEAGLVRPVIYRGVMTAIDHKPDNSALLRHLRRFDRTRGGAVRDV
ncbi:MAG: hypothetical protein WA948_13735 [Pontixanthobacter sp.]